MKKNKKIHEKKLYIVTSLIVCFCVMAVGYAVLTQSLNIDGTAKVTGIWDIKFINVTSTPSGGALNKADFTYNDTTVTFNTTLNEPGDMMTYTVTVKNNGNIPAIVESIILTDSTNSDINYSYNGIAVGNVLEPNATHKFNVVVEYDKSVTTITKASESATLTVNYVQKFGSTITEVAQNPMVLSVFGVDIPITTSGDGLYVDNAEEGRYIFKGKSPLNNITFNNENWQILSIEADGTMKIVKETSIGARAWDAKSNRNSTTDTYCTRASDYGCNAWAKTANLLDTTGHVPTEFKLYYPNGNSSSDTTTYAGSVTKDASLNTYLNGDYFTSTLGDDKQYIVEHKFNVGTPGNCEDVENIAVDVEQEKNYQWLGKVGLITATEYMRTTTNTTCTNLSKANSSSSNCGTNNWLKKNYNYWTISPYVWGHRDPIWCIDSDGFLYNSSTSFSSQHVIPTVYLDSNILLSGNGTTSSKYQITGRVTN